MSSSGRASSSTYWNSKNASPTVITLRLTNIALTTSETIDPAATEPSTAHHIRRNAFSRRTALSSVPELSSTNRHIAWAPAPLDRRSSAAVSRSSIPPYSRAYEPISSDDSPTARCRPRMTTATAAHTYTIAPSASRQSTTMSTQIIPIMVNKAPAARGMTLPMKSETDVTSPSTRWISSPGVCWRWKPWLRPNTCRAILMRMPLVVCHAVTVAIQATAMLINWVAIATIRNSTARRVRAAVVVPCSCLVDDLAHDQRPRQDQRRPDGDEHADADPTPGVGSQQGGKGAPT